jgi:predicted dehydrogenase
VLVVGTGFGARVVAPAFAATRGCEVVDVVSPRDEPAMLAAIRRTDVDLVSVHAPPFLHRTCVLAAVEAGHAVLCDKPFGLHASDAEEMLAAASQAGAVHLANLELRFLPARQALRDLVASGALGRVERIAWSHVSSGTRVPLRPFGWLFDDAAGGGWVRAFAPHALDALRHLLGGAGALAEAWGCRTRAVAERPDADGRPRAVEVEDGLAATLRLSGGAVASFETTFAAAATLPPRVVVVGSDAVAECVGDARLRVTRPGTGPDDVALPGGPPSADRHVDAMRALAAAAHARVTAGEAGPDLATLDDAVACARGVDRLRALPLAV